MGAFAVSSTLRQTTKKQARPEPRSISGVDAEHSSDVLHGYQSTDTGVSGQDTQNKGSKAAFLITDRQLRTLATRDQGELLPQGSGELPWQKESCLHIPHLRLVLPGFFFTTRAHGSGWLSTP